MCYDMYRLNYHHYLFIFLAIYIMIFKLLLIIE